MNFNRPRNLSHNTSESAAISNYQGGNRSWFGNQANSNRSSGDITPNSRGNERSIHSLNSIPHSQSQSNSLRSNGMREGFGPRAIPEGSLMVVPGVEANDEEPSVEIKQTIRTEYKIKKDGIVYQGAINETNIWGSHQHPEY